MYNRSFPLPASKIIRRFRVSPVMTTSIPLHIFWSLYGSEADDTEKSYRPTTQLVYTILIRLSSVDVQIHNISESAALVED